MIYIVSACNNYPSNHPPSINSSLIQCRYAIPPPVPEDDGYFGNAVEQRSKRPIHVCATSVRATVKETSFRYSHQAGGVPSLADLQVIGVQPKKYSRDSEKPVWGMENPGENWNVSDIHLIWGLVDGNKYRSSKGLWTVQSESLYLPSFVTNAQDGTGFGDSMVSTSRMVYPAILSQVDPKPGSLSRARPSLAYDIRAFSFRIRRDRQLSNAP